MIISFDIDNTLIPYTKEFEVIEQNFLSKLIGAEAIRVGSNELFQELEKRGHEICIYTTSHRSIFSLKKTFKSNGLSPKKFINESINRKELNRANCQASKNPKLFGIDIHVDDSAGIEIEGKKLYFKTIIIHPNDQDWVSKILERILMEESNIKAK